MGSIGVNWDGKIDTVVDVKYIFFYNLSCCNKLDLIYKNKVVYASIHVYEKANKNLHLQPFGILRITLDRKV